MIYQNQLDQQKFAHEREQAALEHQFKLTQMAEEFKFKYWEAEQKLQAQREATQMNTAATIEVAKHRPKPGGK